MKISLNWLKDYIKTDLTPERIAEILTDTGLEVEGLEKVESIKGGLEGVIVGEVLSKEKHPDADRLSVTKVNVGNGEPLQIVCGAPNVEKGQKVLVATSGTTLYPNPDEPFKIKKSKIRGVESNGMICAEDELGVGESHDGILVLDETTTVGQLAKDYFGIEDDYLIEIGLTPNRTDGMGHIGVARDLKAYLNTHESANIVLSLPAVNEEAPKGSEINISIENTEACPRYAGAVIKNLKIADSPDWLQNRLRVIGLKPINNVVDITNYVMHETSNPLHAFDLNKVNGSITIRNAKKGEKLITLDEEKRELDEEDLMICNASIPMCIAGIFGGIDSGVSESTNSIFLEAAYFNPVNVRKTAKRHQLNTDSSFRFERGVDPNNVEYAMNRAIDLILEIAGGELVEVHDNYPKKIDSPQVELNFGRYRQLSGTDLENSKIINILNELDICQESVDDNKGVFLIPTYRADVTRESDLIEEVLRIYGYNQVAIPEKLNSSLSYKEGVDRELLYNKTANLLADNGFHEIMNNSLVSSGIWEKMESKSFSSNEHVHILNPLSNELDVMRQTLLFGGLNNIEFNSKRQNPDLKLFEFGKTYKKVNDEYLENQRLGIWTTGKINSENWNHENSQTDFFRLKGIVEGVLTKLGIWKNPVQQNLSNDLFEDGYSLEIGKKKVAQIGWIRKDILNLFDIKNEVFYADLDWDTIMDLMSMNKVNYKPIPKTPSVRRDFSLLLDTNIKFDQIKVLALKIDNRILKEVGLFDVYEGKNLDAGKKSYAVFFIFQDNENTLKDKQVDAIMENIRKSLESELKAELR